MMEIWEVASIAALGIAVPIVMVACCSFRFEEGRIVSTKTEVKWLSAWVPLLILAVAVSIAGGLFERYVYHASMLASMRWLVALSATSICFWSDLKDGVIPNKVVLIVAILAAAACAAEVVVEGRIYSLALLGPTVGCALGGGVFLVSRIVTRGGVGYGDVKLYASLGLLIGVRGMFNVLLYSLGVALFFSVAMLLFKKKKYNDRVPLAPFALIGVLAAMGFGA